jgi:hypothetical protein
MVDIIGQMLVCLHPWVTQTSDLLKIVRNAAENAPQEQPSESTK